MTAPLRDGRPLAIVPAGFNRNGQRSDAVARVYECHLQDDSSSCPITGGMILKSARKSPTRRVPGSFVVSAAMGLVAISAAVSAEDLSTATAPLPPGTFTTSAHSDEWKIANALSAGPEAITRHATVVDWPADLREGMAHGRVLRQGNNGWTCMPDIPGRPQHDPMCVDETMMQWVMATLEGRKPNITKVGLSYMLMGEARQGQGAAPVKDPSQVKEWFYTGPHVMMVLPDSATEGLSGMNQDLSNDLPYTTLLSTSPDATPLWIVPVAKSGHRIKEEPLK